jgi:hypothetical protein
MLASVVLKKRENRDDLDFLQMNGYIPCSIHVYSIREIFIFYQKQVPVEKMHNNMIFCMLAPI